MRFFQLRDEEYFLLQALDGRTPWETLRVRFERTFAPLRLGVEQLQVYLGTLQASGLITRDDVGQGDWLLAQQRARRKGRWWAGFSNLLAIRFRGIDPEPLLRRVYPYCRGLFHPATVALSLALVVGTLLLVLFRYEAWQTRLPGFLAFFEVANLGWIALSIGLAKVLHECGHALTCKHFRGECHELGVMLLVFTPCLYCDVSDAWLMRNKWHRIAVSVAGIYVEVVLAALAALLWWCSEPGLLNTVCLNVMVVCSINTLLFNGNPLLRYDGYYVLSDLVDVPNLRQRADQLLGAALGAWCLGLSRAHDRLLPGRARGWLLGYGLASLVYRTFVIGGILWGVHLLLKPHGLSIVAQFMTLSVVAGTVWSTQLKLRQFLRTATKLPGATFRRATACALLFLVVTGISFYPVPHHLSAPLVIEPADAERVFVTAAGRLPTREHAQLRPRAGDPVRQGEPLVELEDRSLQQQIAHLEGQTQELTSRIEALAVIGVRQRDAANQVPTVVESLRHLKQQLEQLRNRQKQLTLVAPRDGVVLPPESQHDTARGKELPGWTGTPLDEQCAGSTLEAGTVYCWIGDPTRLSAVLVVDQSQIEFVHAGQRVRFWLNELPGTVLTGEVTDVADAELDTVPSALSATGYLAVKQQGGELRPTGVMYQVRATVDTGDLPVPLRSTGWAAIEVAPQTLLSRALRYLADTFRVSSR